MNLLSEIVYSIREGDRRSHFSIHPSTGLLYVAKKLDAEYTHEYRLVVEARWEFGFVAF